MVDLQTWMSVHNAMHTTRGIREGLEVYSKNYKTFVGIYGSDSHKVYLKLLHEKGDIMVNKYLQDLQDLQTHELELIQLLGLSGIPKLRQFIKTYIKYKDTLGLGWYIGFNPKSLEINL